jgi:hypothetical protein
MSLSFLPSYSLRSTLADVTVTTLWSSFWPRSIIWRTFEPSTGLTASLLACCSLDVLPKRPGLWNIKFVTARCKRSMCVELKENFQGTILWYCYATISCTIQHPRLISHPKDWQCSFRFLCSLGPLNKFHDIMSTTLSSTSQMISCWDKESRCPVAIVKLFVINNQH